MEQTISHLTVCLRRKRRLFCSIFRKGFLLYSCWNFSLKILIGSSHLVYSHYMVKVVKDDQLEGLDVYLRLGRVATSAKKAVIWVMVDKDLDVRFSCNKWALLR